MASRDKKIIAGILVVVFLIIVIPLFIKKGANFGGTDDMGIQKIESMKEDYEPWFTPVLEMLLGRELPREVESFIFCIQTGIGVGVISFVMGRLVERKKWKKKQ